MEILRVFISVILTTLGVWWLFFGTMMTDCNSLSDKIIGKVIPIFTGCIFVLFAVLICMI